MNVHHGRAHTHTCHESLERTFIRAIVVGHIGRRTAHVKSNDLAYATQGRRTYGANDATGWAGKYRILTLEQTRIGQAAVRLHEHEPCLA